MQSMYVYQCARRPQFLLAGAAVVVSLGSVAILLAGFDASSPRRWLVPTAHVTELVARCDTFADRAQREACAQTVVAALLEQQQRELVLAQR